MKFPYPLRRYQGEILSWMERALEGGHLVLQSGTGSGKTVCALYASLQRALEEDMVVLYLVRTNSQQRQVMVELRHLGPYGLALQGRQRLCLLAKEDRALSHGSPEELSHFCRDRKEEVFEGEGGCSYYRGLLETDVEKVVSWCRDSLPTAEETAARCEAVGICPYELNKLLAPQARVVTAPFIYFFSPPLRRALLETMERPIEDVVLIVDEAHNLPEYCREIASFDVSMRAIERAEGEVMDYHDPQLSSGITAFDLLEVIETGILELASEHVVEEDGFLPPSAVEAHIMHALTVTSTKLKGLLSSLAALGEVVREARRRRGLLPRSYILSVAGNVLRWMSMDDVEYAKLILGGENPALRAYCLDPSIAAEPILQCYASIHMSGTLEPLQEYRDSIGLPDSAILRSFPSPFPRENRRVVYVDGVTTRYEELARDPEVVTRLRGEVHRLLEACDRNTLFLFPSYGLLDSFVDLVEGPEVPVHVEKRGMSQGELMRSLDAFKASTSAFFAVTGGRIAEGMDFPARELEVVVIVGIPYPKPTATLRSLVKYYDWKFRKGWEYAVVAPTSRRLQQCVGRLIRSEGDRGIAIILDRRAVYFKKALGAMDLVENTREAVDAHLTPGPSPARR